MSTKGFKGLYTNIAVSHGDCIEALKKAIKDEEYDFEGFTEMIKDDDEEFDDLLNNNNLGNQIGLKDAIRKYMNDWVFVIDNDEQMIIEKIVKYFFNGIINKIQDDKELKTFAEDINCMDLYDPEDRVYNECFRISINNGNQNESLILSLVDNYMRYYFNEYRKGNIKSIDEWWADKLPKYNDTKHEQMKLKYIAGMKSFSKRICPRILLPPNQLIDDNINLFAKMVIQILESILDIINRNYSLPLQLDFVIHPRNISHVNDDYDDDDDAKSVDESNNNNNARNNMNFPDDMKNIQDDYVDFTNASQNSSITRKLVPLLQKLNRNGRFVVMINRKPKSNPNIFTFKPQKFNTIHKKYVPESFIHNAKYILEPKGAKSGSHFGANDGSVFSLSFHLLNKNIIKCYQFWGTCFARFLIDDIINVWPYFFPKINGQNQSISDDIIPEIKKLANKLPMNYDIDHRLI